MGEAKARAPASAGGLADRRSPAASCAAGRESGVVRPRAAGAAVLVRERFGGPLSWCSTVFKPNEERRNDVKKMGQASRFAGEACDLRGDVLCRGGIERARGGGMGRHANVRRRRGGFDWSSLRSPFSVRGRAGPARKPWARPNLGVRRRRRTPDTRYPTSSPAHRTSSTPHRHTPASRSGIEIGTSASAPVPAAPRRGASARRNRTLEHHRERVAPHPRAGTVE